MQQPEQSAGPSNRSPLAAAAPIALAAMFLLCGYEAVRSTANTLFKAAYGAEALPYVMMLMPLGVIGMLYGYGRLLSRLGPRRTLLATSLLSGLGIGACFLAIQAGSKAATGALYILREAYIVLLIEQYWSFLNSRLGVAVAKRLNGPIAGLASLGAIAGGSLVYHYSARFGAASMLLLGAGCTIPAALCSEAAYALCGEPRRAPTEAPAPRDHLGVSLFRANRTLVFLLLIVVATQVLSTVLELSFQGLLQKEIPSVDAQNAYSGRFFAQLNAAAALSQFVLAPLLLRFVPMLAVHLAIPLANMAACVYLSAQPSLASAQWAYLTFKTLDYSVFRAAKEVLYIPLSFDVRFRAKEVIDVFGYRFGKGWTSALVALSQRAGAVFTPSLFGAISAATAAVWAALVWPVLKKYDK